MEKIKWSQYIGYEVSTRGDKRFSPFYAMINDKSIEEIYQLDIKGYRKYGNNAMLGKGKPPLYEISKDELYKEYRKLWIKFAKENVDLMQELYEKVKDNGFYLKDSCARGPINQARALADILNKMVKEGMIK